MQQIQYLRSSNQAITSKSVIVPSFIVMQSIEIGSIRELLRALSIGLDHT